MSGSAPQNQNANLKTDLRSRTYQFSLTIIQFVSVFPNQRVYWILADQLLRAATSVGANIIEAKASSSRKEFIKYYEIALKSSNETLYWLLLLKDSHLVTDAQTLPIIQESTEISNMLGSSILTLKGKKRF